jgi:hypothetical protein
MTITVIRCCPSAEKSLCLACVGRLPERKREHLVRTYWDGDLLGHAKAADDALGWLKAHRGGRYGTAAKEAAEVSP